MRGKEATEESSVLGLDESPLPFTPAISQGGGGESFSASGEDACVEVAPSGLGESYS